MKFTQAETKNIEKIYRKIDFILADIPKAMYGMSLKEFLCGCNHDAIVSLFHTIHSLFTFSETPHNYIWDTDTFEKCQKKIESKSIKKDMSSSTYKAYVEKIIDCCYPSALPYLGLMIVLNADYNTDWRDIHNYFYLCEFRPQYREMYRLRPARQVKKYKPLTDNMIKNALWYTGYSKMKLPSNIWALQKAPFLFRGFIHILCGLQASREDYKFFDGQLLEEVIDDYWYREFKDSLTEYDERAITSDRDITLLEMEIRIAEDSNDAKGKNDNEIRKFKEQIEEIKRFAEQYKEDYEAQIQHIYNGFGNKSDIWPTDEQCNELWKTYRHTDDVLLNTIAVLTREIKGADWNRVIAYYAVPERRIMLDENPELDKDSGDPFIINPKLKRPLTDNLVNGLKFSPKYQNATAEQIDIKWEENNKSDLRRALMFIIYGLQSSGAAIIKADTFSEVFKSQIENYKNGGSYNGVELEMIHIAIKDILDDKKDEVCKIAILLDKGYKVPEVGNFFHKRILG